MNCWIVTALALLVCMIPCFVLCLRGDAMTRLIGLEAGSTMAVMVLLALTEAFNQSSFVDLALTLALLTYGSGLVFARFLERWL